MRVGQQQADYLVKHLPNGKGKIVRIHGAPTDDNAKVLKAGQDKILKPYFDRGDIQVIHEDWAEDWKPENGKKIVNAAITRIGRDFDAVLAAKRRHGRRRDPGAHRGGHRRQGARDRSGRRAAGAAAHRRGHADDDHLQAPQGARHQGRGGGGPAREARGRGRAHHR